VKALAIVEFTAAGLTGILLAKTRTIILKSFERLEKNEVEQDMKRVENAVADEIASLESTGRDCSWWGETSSFVQGNN
jgi:sensor domain CHASE-containing protein